MPGDEISIYFKEIYYESIFYSRKSSFICKLSIKNNNNGFSYRHLKCQSVHKIKGFSHLNCMSTLSLSRTFILFVRPKQCSPKLRHVIQLVFNICFDNQSINLNFIICHFPGMFYTSLSDDCFIHIMCKHVFSIKLFP